jgi:hypothetical protein
MKNILRKIENIWFVYKIDFDNWIGKNFPFYICKKFPEISSKTCSECHGKFSKIIAIDTGDGWEFMWECENNCGYCEPICDWWPFWFGKWASCKDLNKIGIETY